MPRQVLVIDDEEAVRDGFEFALTHVGYQVDTARNGQEGVAKAQQRCPDLAFVDLRMPGMDGVETLRHLKRRCPELPVCVVTAFRKDFLQPLKAASEEGLTFSIADKPLNMDQIQAIARGILEGGTAWETME